MDDLAVFTPTGEDIALAHERSCAMGILPGSYMRGMGNLTGCLGEIAVNAYLPRSRYVGNEIFTHDLVYKKQKVGNLSQISVLLLTAKKTSLLRMMSFSLLA